MRDSRESVIITARRWLGTPFVHQACILGAGVGCGTLLTAVYGECGFLVPSVNEIGFFPHDWHFHTKDERYLRIITKFTHEVKEPKMGDIVLVKIGSVFGHSGIIEEWPSKVIHVMWGRSVEYINLAQTKLYRKQRVFLSPFNSE